MPKIKNIIFPENNTDTIEQILNDFSLSQTKEEVEKLRRNNIPRNAFTFAKLIKKIGTEEITFEEFIKELSLQLKIEMPKAQQIAQEVKTKLLDQIENSEEQIENQQSFEIKEKIFPSGQAGQKKTGSDDYRESVE